ncbi:tumor necrosis factor receptor superfamily member 3-like isoform X1 [Lampetra planeri]
MSFVAVHVVVLCVLIGVVHTAQGFCNLSTQYEVNGLCCDQCPPGHFRSAWCTADSPTGCQPCPEGTFNSEYNIYPRCEYCTRCISGFHQVTIENCTPTRNTRCGCEKDKNITKFAKDGTLFWCCPKCPTGMETLNECSFTDFITTCTDCPPGTFSNHPGSSCQNCTRCEREQSPCTNASDAVCSGRPRQGPDVSAAIAAVAGCILLGITVLMVLMVPSCFRSTNGCPSEQLQFHGEVFHPRLLSNPATPRRTSVNAESE